MHSFLRKESPVNSLKKEVMHFSLAWPKSLEFHLLCPSTALNESRALSVVVEGMAFKNVKRFSNSFIDSMALLKSNCFESRHLACFTIMGHSGVHYFFNSETSLSVTRSFLIISRTVSLVANLIFNLLRLKKFSSFARLSFLKADPEAYFVNTSSFIKSCRIFLTKSVRSSYMNVSTGQSVWYTVKNSQKSLATKLNIES